jgi:ribosome biogenesis GTPase / thiamine phosphate phosphatase
MKLQRLGWEQYQRNQKKVTTDGAVGRVGVENKTNFVLLTAGHDLQGIIQGKFRRTAKTPSDFPKVGDWVVYKKLPGEDKAIIEKVLPRYSIIARKAAGDSRDAQVIAANVDNLFIVFGLDQKLNLPLLQRYLTMAEDGHVTPIIILNKIDKTKFSTKLTDEVRVAAPEVGVYAISAKTEAGPHKLQHLIKSGQTIAFVGPSGAGKSTLLNALIGSKVQATAEVRAADSKGRHTTTRREMFLLPGDGILIDTPGIRELENLPVKTMQKFH